MAEPAVAAPDSNIDIDSLVTKSLASMPKADYGKAAESLTKVGKEEAAATERATGSYLGSIERDKTLAHEKYNGIEPADVKPWNADQERQKYQTDPLVTFGSFWNVAVVAASAFTRQPLVNSLTASAAFINARADKNDQAYNDNYKAWKENTDLAMKRHQMERESFDDALKLMSTDESAGKAELAAVMAKYGMKKKMAMMEAGMFPELMEAWSSEVKAYEGMSKARDEIEVSNLMRSAVSRENEDRKAANKPPMSPTEELQFKSMIGGGAKTPEQQILTDAYRKFKTEHPDASSDDEMKFLQQFYLGKYSYKGGATAVQADHVLEDYKGVVKDILPSEESIIRSGFGTKGTYGASVAAKMAGAVEQIKQLYASGNPPSAADRMKILSDAAENKLSEESLHQAAVTWARTGQMPSRLSRGMTGQAIMDDIMREGRKWASENSMDTENLPLEWQRYKVAAEARASANALSKMTQQKAAIDQFEKTAIKNGDYLVQLANKVDSTGVPAMERWIRAGRKAVAGDVDVTKFDAQWQLYTTEVAKIMTNPNMTGVLSDSARHEAQEILPKASTPQMVAGVHNLIKRDFGFRSQAIDETIQGLKDEIHGRTGGKPSNEMKPPLVRQDGHIFQLQSDGSYKDVTGEK